MVYHRFLFGSVLWTVFIMLLALPRGLQTLFIIIGIIPVLLVALALTKAYRLSKRPTQTSQAITQKEQNVEQMLDKAADQIVETILEHPGLVHDAEIETRNVVHQLYEALGETDPHTHSDAIPAEESMVVAPKVRRPRKLATLSESLNDASNQDQQS